MQDYKRENREKSEWWLIWQSHELLITCFWGKGHSSLFACLNGFLQQARCAYIRSLQKQATDYKKKAETFEEALLYLSNKDLDLTKVESLMASGMTFSNLFQHFL